MSWFGLGISQAGETKKQTSKPSELGQLAQQSIEGERQDSDDEILASRKGDQEGPMKLFAQQDKKGDWTSSVCTGFGCFSWASSGPPTALREEKGDKLVAVIVTIFEGSSYDENFRVMEPQTVPGERVSTYSLRCHDVGQLHDYLVGTQQAPAASAWQELLDDIRAVPADSITFNWECCSGCSEHGFPGSRHSRRRGQGWGWGWFQAAAASPTMQIMGLALQRGFTVMCSDFSLKALIADWSEEHLGPNPFVKMQDECDREFQLDFLPSDLQHEEVPQQLQVIGELCAEQGKAIVAAMSDTIVYTVNPRRAQTDVYDLKVLTVVSDWSGGHTPMPEAMKCSVGSGDSEKRGAAGHVTLTYASGGQLLTSMGHWIELTRLDTALDSVIQVVARNFGQEEMTRFQTEYADLRSDTERQGHVQKWSKEMVQKSVPTRMKMRTKF